MFFLLSYDKTEEKSRNISKFHFVFQQERIWQKGILFCKAKNNRQCSNILFLSLNKKSIKRNQPKGRYENAPPLETPAASPSDTRKCPDFRVSANTKLSRF